MAGKMEQMKEELDKKDQEVKRLRSHLNKSAAIQMKAEMAEMEVEKMYCKTEILEGGGGGRLRYKLF